MGGWVGGWGRHVGPSEGWWRAVVTAGGPGPAGRKVSAGVGASACRAGIREGGRARAGPGSGPCAVRVTKPCNGPELVQRYTHKRRSPPGGLRRILNEFQRQIVLYKRYILTIFFYLVRLSHRAMLLPREARKCKRQHQILEWRGTPSAEDAVNPAEFDQHQHRQVRFLDLSI